MAALRRPQHRAIDSAANVQASTACASDHHGILLRGCEGGHARPLWPCKPAFIPAMQEEAVARIAELVFAAKQRRMSAAMSAIGLCAADDGPLNSGYIQAGQLGGGDRIRTGDGGFAVRTGEHRRKGPIM
jgi:hypothetical protein